MVEQNNLETAERKEEPCFEIQTVSLNEKFDRIALGAIYSPAEGFKSGVYSLTVSGWVLGRSSPASYVRLMYESVEIRTAPVRELRHDVAATYPGYSEAIASGFFMPILIVGLSRHFTLRIEVVFGDGEVEVFGVIHGCRRRLIDPTPASLKPIMVLFVGRCGSTAIMRMLSEHPSIVVAGRDSSLYEVGFANYLLKSLHVLAGKPNLQNFFLEDGPALRAFEYYSETFLDQDMMSWFGLDYPNDLARFVTTQVESFYRVVRKALLSQSRDFFARRYRLTILRNLRLGNYIR